MPEIVLTNEQARVVAEASTPILIRDPNGAALGILDPAETTIIAEARRRIARPGARYSTASVLAMLDAFTEERERIGRFDEAYAIAFAEKMETDNPAAFGPQVEK